MSHALLHPAYLFFAAAAIAAALPPRVARWLLVITPAIGLALLIQLQGVTGGEFTLFGLELVTFRADRLAFIFGVIFHIAALLAGVYAFHLRDRLEQSMTLLYAGAAIGAVLAGDLLTLFIHWELTAISSALIVWAARTPQANAAGLRYMLWHIGSGLLVLGGVIIHVHATGDLTFDALGLDAPGGLLILLGFGIKAGFPLLHNWMQDTYPRATPSGTVTLSSFSTKLAIYALARGYAGEEVLIWIGVVMTLFPIFFAVIENDLRKVLAYSLNNQLGFMVVGIGIGTELAINGAAAHAFAHILYKSLLFMSMGAVLYRTGTALASQLGGLWRSMPVTMACCIIASLSISGFPLFSGFVTKSMTMDAVSIEHLYLIWGLLMFASAGVVDHSGIKVPFFAFFAHDSGQRPRGAPLHMRVAMLSTAGLCIGIGLFPGLLYNHLPYPTDFVPYTAGHVIAYLQLLFFAALAFVWLFQSGRYPDELRSTNLDSDWLIRKPLFALATGVYTTLARLRDSLLHPAAALAERAIRRVFIDPARPDALLGGAWRSGAMVLWAVGLIGLYVLLFVVG